MNYANSTLAGTYGEKIQPEYRQPTMANEVRRTEVDGEFSRLAKAQEQMRMVAQELAERLNSVRRQTGQLVGQAEPTPPEPLLCSLAGAIRDHAKETESVTAVLQTALRELEI